MNACDEIRARLILYLDDELHGGERSLVERHLLRCEACRALFAVEQDFVRSIRQSHPVAQASPELRARVADLLDNSGRDESEKEPAPVRISGHSLDRIVSRRAVAVAAVLLMLILPILVGLVLRNNRGSIPASPSEFALMAADTHLRHIRGQLPLEISSETASQISGWFANKVGFSVKLPNYQESSGQEKLYRLEGARLVGYKDDYAAYVAYQMRTRPISLVITSDRVARPAGGEEINAKGLTFHCDAIEGLKVITWSDRGLTYALVSDLEERGQQSCIVCHQGVSDQDFIAPLNLK
jgi:anti-sigma factor RsiW